MLVSLEHKFIFVANIKTASTAIEAALGDRCQITLDRSEWGKHVSLSHIETEYSSIFESVPRNDFTVFGVMRDPVDWMYSLYRSHKSVQFEGLSLDTAGMSFSEFLAKWSGKNGTQLRDQHSQFRNAKGEFGIDYIIRYEKLNADFDRLMHYLGVRGCTLSFENVSVDTPYIDAITRQEVAFINDRYRIDRQILEAYGGVLHCKIRHESDSGTSDEVTDDLFERSEMERRKRFALRPITRDDVIWAFRMLLGRDPESEEAVKHHLECRTRDELRLLIMSSAEFAIIMHSLP